MSVAGKKGSTIYARVANSTMGRLRAYADREGLTLSSATAFMLERGLDQRDAEALRQCVSECCDCDLYASRGDGVWVGSCSGCGKTVVRINPRTLVEEWLDGHSPWTDAELRPVRRAA